MLNDRENILSALREKPLKVYEVMKRANVANEEACQQLLLKMRDEGLVKFDIHKGRWQIGEAPYRHARACPGIHVLLSVAAKRWMAGTSPAMTSSTQRARSSRGSLPICAR